MVHLPLPKLPLAQISVMVDFNLLGTFLTDLYQEVDPLEFRYLEWDTLHSVSLKGM